MLTCLQQQTAQRVLTQFQENPDSWQRVPAILETSQNLNTKVRHISLSPANHAITDRRGTVYRSSGLGEACPGTMESLARGPTDGYVPWDVHGDMS